VPRLLRKPTHEPTQAGVLPHRPGKKEKALPVAEAVRAVRVGEMKGYTIRLDTEIYKALQEFAIKYDLSTGDMLTFSLAKGMDALTGDTLKPYAKVTFPAVWEYLARNEHYERTVVERYQDYLKSLRGKVELKKDPSLEGTSV